MDFGVRDTSAMDGLTDVFVGLFINTDITIDSTERGEYNPAASMCTLTWGDVYADMEGARMDMR